MSTSVSLVGLGLTEVIPRIHAYTFKQALQGVHTAIGNVHILYRSQEQIKCLFSKHIGIKLIFTPSLQTSQEEKLNSINITPRGEGKIQLTLRQEKVKFN